MKGPEKKIQPMQTTLMQSRNRQHDR
jgi:hypothetical protein